MKARLEATAVAILLIILVVCADGAVTPVYPEGEWAEVARRLNARKPRTAPPLPPMPIMVSAVAPVSIALLFEIDPSPSIDATAYWLEWGTERGVYTDTVVADMTNQIITARATGLLPGTTYYFAARALSDENFASAYFPTNGFRWPERYVYELAIQNNPTLTNWQTLLVIPGLFTNIGDILRLEGFKRLEE